LYNGLGEVLLSARDRATDEPSKRSAIDAALIEFEHGWEKAVAYLRLRDAVSARDWVASYAGFIAGLYEQIRNVEQARLFYGHQLIARRELVPDESKPLTIDVETTKRDLASALMDLGFLEQTQGDKSKAIEPYRECVTIMEAQVGKSSAPANQQSLGICYAGLADSIGDDDKRAEAIANYQKALAIQEKLAAAEPGDANRQSTLAYVYEGLANALLADGRRAEAIAAYETALAVREKLAAAQADNADRQVDVARAHIRLAGALLADGKPAAEAHTHYQKASAILEQIVAQTEQAEVAANGKPRVETATRLGQLAWYALFTREFDKALGSANRALGIAPEKTWIQVNRAHALMLLRRVDEARSLYLQYRGAKNVEGAKSWEDAILKDFAELRKAGLSDPLMAEIEKTFGAGG
jgi:tetratricopeptide (TPR) repeat protein